MNNFFYLYLFLMRYLFHVLHLARENIIALFTFGNCWEVSVKASDAPTFGIAETTWTDHFSLSLRKLLNRNRPEPTLKSKLILQKFMIIIWPMFMDWSNEYHDAHLSNAYTLIQWVSWILNVVYYSSPLLNVMVIFFETSR